MAVTTLVVGSGGRVVTEGMMGTEGSSGYPLHLRNSAFQITRSFGTDDPTIDPRRMLALNDYPQWALQRVFTSANATSYWVHNDFRFLLERYDFEGRLLARFRHELDGWYGEGTGRKPSPGEFRGLLLDGVQTSSNENIIWLIYHDPRPEYVKPDIGPVDHMKAMSMHDLVVEAFDTRQNRVIATGRWRGVSGQRVGHANDKIALIQPIDDVFFTFRIVTLAVSQRP